VVPTLAVPRLIKFAGTLKDAQGKSLSNTVGLTFAIYKDQEGGAPLWLETQNVQLDEQGHYSVLLGATKSEGLPLELFSSGEPRWLGVQVQLPGEVEGPRVLLVSVPYALKAADADRLGGIPASAFVLAAPSVTASGTSVSGSTPASAFVLAQPSGTASGTSVSSSTPGKTTASGTGKTAAPLVPKVTADVTQALTFVGITPCRIIETRGFGWTGQAGPPSLVANAQRTFQITGTVPGLPAQCGVPDTAVAISVNFTATDITGAGDIRAFPAGGAAPLASILNYRLETIANSTTVPLGPSGGGHNGITVQCDTAGTDFLADVNGYYVPRPFNSLESGQTLVGEFMLSFNATAAGQSVYAPLNFQVPLASAPTPNFLPSGGPFTANCPAFATAAKGQLCLYVTNHNNDTATCLFGSVAQVGCGTVDPFGAVLAVNSVAAGLVYIEGEWAVTAP
jgi:hypothetical protein